MAFNKKRGKFSLLRNRQHTMNTIKGTFTLKFKELFNKLKQINFPIVIFKKKYLLCSEV